MLDGLMFIINNNNNGLLTVYPPSGSSPVKNYNRKTIICYKNKIELKSTIYKRRKNMGL